MKKLLILFLLLTSTAPAQFAMVGAWNDVARPVGDTIITNLGDSLLLYIAGYGATGADQTALPTIYNMAESTGAAHDLTQSDGAKQPKLADSTYKWIIFDGSNDYAGADLVNKYIINDSTAVTFYMVFKPYRWIVGNHSYWGSDAVDRVQSFNQAATFGMYSSATTLLPRGPLTADSMYVVFWTAARMNSSIWVNGVQYFGSPGIGNIKRFDLGGFVPQSQYGPIGVFEMAATHSPIPERKKYAIAQDRATKYGFSLQAQYDSINVIFEGNSLTQGVFTAADSTYPKQATVLLSADGLNVRWRNIGLSGDCISPLCGNTMLDDTATQLNASIIPTASKNVLVIWAGTVELAAGYDSTTIYNAIVDYCTRRQKDFDQIFVLTCLPLQSNATKNANMEGLNRLLRANYLSFSDVLVDIQADPNIGDIGDETGPYYYADQVHLNGAGYAIVAEYVKNAIIANP